MADIPAIFIDGEAGTTGLQIRARLQGRGDVRLLSLPDAHRKDPVRRAAIMNEADLVVLCLPDDAAREAVTLIENPRTRVLDASSAFRTHPDWVYGLPELTPGQRSAIAAATRVSNPGCYPTGAVSLIRPLVEAGLLPTGFPVTVNAVSGYSGGGRKMIEDYELGDTPRVRSAHRIYGLHLEHKHTEEMRVHGGLEHRPLFAPSVGRYRQGMIVQIPLQLWAAPGTATGHHLHEALKARYADEPFIRVMDLGETATIATLDPEDVNGTNLLRLYVFANDARRQALLVAVLDNLGKGASGAAVQNINLMLGLDPKAGLEGRHADPV